MVNHVPNTENNQRNKQNKELELFGDLRFRRKIQLSELLHVILNCSSYKTKSKGKHISLRSVFLHLDVSLHPPTH